MAVELATDSVMPTPRSLDDVSDSALFTVMRYGSRDDLLSTLTLSKRFKEIGEDPRIWEGLTDGYFHPDFEYVSAHPKMADLPWREKFRTWDTVQKRWAGKSAAGAPKMVTGARVGQQALFCVNHIGGGQILTAGGDGTVRVVALEHLEPESSSSSSSSSSASGSAAGGQPTSRMVIKASQDAHSAGMLGMSVDMDAISAGLASGVACKNVIAVSGSFNGEATAWRVNWNELSQLHALPAKRLKQILTDRGVKIDGLREKEEFVAKVKAWDALPLLKQVCRLPGHSGTIVSTSNHGDLALTGGNDGDLRVWRLGLKDSAQAGLCLAELPSPTSRYGIDSVHLDPRWGTAFAGNKAGMIDVYDLGAGGRLVTSVDASGGPGSSQRRPWIWSVRSGSTWANSAGHEPGCPRYGATNDVDYGHSIVKAKKSAWSGDSSSSSSSSSSASAAVTSDRPPTWLYERDSPEAAVRAAVAATKDGEDDEDMSAAEREDFHGSINGASAGGRAAGRSSSSAAAGACVSSHDVESGVGSLGDGRHLLSGDTSGWVRLWDLRACGAPGRSSSLKAARSYQLPMPAGPHAAEAMGGFGGNPIAGLAPMFAHNRFVTASFDGCVRVFDLRMFKPVSTLRYSSSSASARAAGSMMMGYGGTERLCRVDATPDMVVTGSMEGTVVAWGMWQEGRA